MAESDSYRDNSLNLSDLSEQLPAEDSEDEIEGLRDVLEPRHNMPYMFEPYLSDSDGEETEQEAAPEFTLDIGRLQNTEWCTCDNCHDMPLVEESQCCKEMEAVTTEMRHAGTDTCIVDHPGFGPCCLDPYVLRIANYAFIDNHGHHGPVQDQHERYRYIAYRQFVRLCWGHLGKDVRVPLPSCVVNKIRSTFPSADYVGYMHPPLEH